MGETEGRLFLPEGVEVRCDLGAGTRLIPESSAERLALHLARPDVRRAYIEVTARCNLDCVMCVRHVWEDVPGEMSWETFEAVVEGLRAFPHLRRVTFGGYGEPLAHPRFPEMAARVAELGAEVVLTTNGLLLDGPMAKQLLDAGVGRVVVSLDTMHIQAYARAQVVAGVDQVLDNMRTLREKARQRGKVLPRIGMEFVVMRSNLKWLARLPRLARELEADFVLVSNLLPHTEKMAREILYDRDEPLPAPTGWPVSGGDLVLWGMARLPRMKWGAWRRCRFIEERSIVIGWDGGVSPCYALMHSYPYYIYGRRKEVRRYVLGRVPEQTLADIWMSAPYVLFRAKVREMRFPSCVDCGMACTYTEENADCWGNSPSCADCLWSQGIVQCP